MTMIEVLRAGMLTTVQDWPGRRGYWHVGVPPSGPMDDRSFRLGNRALCNAEGAPGLECLLQGPELRFSAATAVCVCGAPAPVTLDGAEITLWTPTEIPARGVLAIGAITGRACARTCSWPAASTSPITSEAPPRSRSVASEAARGGRSSAAMC